MFGFCKFEKKIEKEQYEIKCIKDYIENLKSNPELENSEALIKEAQEHLSLILRNRTNLN